MAINVNEIIKSSDINKLLKDISEISKNIMLLSGESAHTKYFYE